MASSYHTEIGKLLRETREDLRLSLQQASAALHIRAHYLHALEEGGLDELPGAAYTRGYLQSYAIFLHLDKEEILRRFDRMENDLPKKGMFFPKVFSKEKSPVDVMVWGGALLALFTYLVWFFMFRPEFTPLSVVMPPPVRDESIIAAVEAHSVLNLSCVTSQVVVYPACYRVGIDKMIKKSILPQRHKINSILELGR